MSVLGMSPLYCKCCACTIFFGIYNIYVVVISVN